MKTNESLSRQDWLILAGVLVVLALAVWGAVQMVKSIVTAVQSSKTRKAPVVLTQHEFVQAMESNLITRVIVILDPRPVPARAATREVSGILVKTETERKLNTTNREAAEVPFTASLFLTDDALQALLSKPDVESKAPGTARHFVNEFGSLLVQLVFFGILILLAWWLIRKWKTGETSLLALGSNQAKVVPAGEEKTTFKDVAGATEAKQELVTLVNYLKDDKPYLAVGAKVPKGILLVGPPGTGKTLLARALAGEAQAHFQEISASSFEELLVGVGTRRVKNLFALAKKKPPAIIFIDEIDAVGRNRESRIFNSSANQCLNQLLTELDGFEASDRVIVIAATNRVEMLDAALTRAGRFDKLIEVPLPNAPERFEILKIHVRERRKLSSDVDLEKIAAAAEGASGADLAALVNNAAILAGAEKCPAILHRHFDAAAKKFSVPERSPVDLAPFGGEMNILSSLAQNPAVVIPAGTNSTRFDDVAGVEEAKEALKIIVNFLKNPKQFELVRARLPRGILLVGPPGTGKTLLARALAGEANAHFQATTAASFEEMLVGVGSRRIREMFKLARRNKPSVIFIDEIDAIGQHRDATLTNASHNQALNQLLAELDGFEPSDQIVVIAATNRVEVLDEALIRAGRFDKHIEVPLPPLKDRIRILEIHTRNKPKPKVNLDAIAESAVGASGADLATIANEAAILAGDRESLEITQNDFEVASRKVASVIPQFAGCAEIELAVAQKVVGQVSAVSAIAESASQHFKGLRLAFESRERMISKANAFIYGPSGTGKTAIVNALSQIIPVPFAATDALSLAQDPNRISRVLRRLLTSAKNDVRRAEFGIVLIYGMEDLLTPQATAAQEELARFIQGGKYEVPRDPHSIHSRTVLIDTSPILFICECSLKDASAMSKQPPRFGRSTRNGEQFALRDGLESLGFSGRLIDNFPHLACTVHLGQTELKEILLHEQISPLSEYKTRIGGDIPLSASMHEEIAREAFARGGSARSLIHIVQEILNCVPPRAGDSIREDELQVGYGEWHRKHSRSSQKKAT